MEIIPYKEKIDFEVKDILSEEADKYNLMENSIVIFSPNREEPYIFSSYFELRKLLQNHFDPI